MKPNFKVILTSAALFLLFLCWKNDHKLTIYSIGDSTMCNMPTTDNFPGRGWMQMIAPFFDSQTTINNMAASGRSSKSFRGEGKWAKVIAKVQPGDYVFIQFGHNDEKPDTLRHTDAETTFRQNIINYVNEVKAKNAHPVLFTSITRRRFDKSGKLIDTHGKYVSVIRELAPELNVPLVDLNKKTTEMVQELGPEESKKLYINVGPGVTPKLPKGRNDDTHLCIYGATKVAGLAAQELKALNLPGLSEHIK